MQDIPLEEIRARTSRPVVYAEGYNDTKIPDEALLAQAEAAAAQAECAVVFAGAMLPPETDDYNRPTMDIEPAQEALIRRAAAVNKNVIVVLMNCESVVMPWIDGIRAVLDMWYCGQGCGAAAAQLLFGERSPGGKLPVTMPRRLEDCPDYLHFPGENHRHLYGEGIYVGYRYYDKKRVEPLFPFGHGLSYTAFTYSDLRFSQDHLALPGEVEVSCGVRNILVENCTFTGTDVGVRFKSCLGRGGVVENILIRNIRMDSIKEQIVQMEMGYHSAIGSEEDVEAKYPEEDIPEFRSIQMEDILCIGARSAVEISGLRCRPIRDITIKNSYFQTEKGVNCQLCENVRLENVTIAAGEEKNVFADESISGPFQWKA